MIQSKEYIIHQIANDIKTHIGQKYKDKSNIDWGLYTGLELHEHINAIDNIAPIIFIKKKYSSFASEYFMK